MVWADRAKLANLPGESTERCFQLDILSLTIPPHPLGSVLRERPEGKEKAISLVCQHHLESAGLVPGAHRSSAGPGRATDAGREAWNLGLRLWSLVANGFGVTL